MCLTEKHFFQFYQVSNRQKTLAITSDDNHDHHFSIETRAVQRPLCPPNLQELGMTTFRTIQLITLTHESSALLTRHSPTRQSDHLMAQSQLPWHPTEFMIFGFHCEVN
jgi:hypothetical protein